MHHGGAVEMENTQLSHNLDSDVSVERQHDDDECGCVRDENGECGCLRDTLRRRATELPD